jgi:transglutaminase-like putative cysteine protease
MNHRLTLTAAAAVVLASISIYPLIQGWGWFWAGAGAAVIVAAAGTLTRLAAAPATVAAGVLAIVACYPLLASPAWYGKAAAVLIVAAAVAGLTGRRVLAALACLITYLAALLIYLNAVFAAGRSLAGVVPTSASVHYLRVLASQGTAERAYVPPVPGIHGIVLLVAGGVGLMAVATDLLAVRLRSPAIAGLPLLALYSVPITTNARQGGIGATVVFCLGISGYLAMLAADGRDRLRIWGRLVTVWQYRDTEAARGPDTRALAAAGRRIGLAAISIAILLPLLIPGISVHGLFRGGGPPGKGGATRVQLPDPLAQMHGQLKETSPKTVLTYQTTAPDPQEQYLEVYVLNYNGDTGQWSLVAPGSNSTTVGSRPLPAAPGTSRGTTEITSRTRVTVAPGVEGYEGDGSKVSFLPVPYAPASLGVPGYWVEDNTTLMVYSDKTQLSGLTYAVTSQAAEPSVPQLEKPPATGTAASNYTGVPPTGQQQLDTLALKITSGASSAFDKALALQRWFTTGNRFRYSLNPRVPDSTAGLIEFLTRTRQGYCQQFAVAMAVLARMVDIPSRIAVGYTAGVSQGNGTWKVSTADAHAWPELYFAGSGWLRFEPTPGGGDGGQATAVEPAYARTPLQGPGSNGTPGPAPSISPGAGSGSASGGNLAKLRHLTGSAAGKAASVASHRSGGIAPLGLIVAVVLGVALITPGTARMLIRRARWRRAADDAGFAEAAWRELQDDLADHGMACRDSESPRAVARRVGTALGLEAVPRQALARIASAEERARYAATPQPSGTLRQDVTLVRRAMSQETDRPVRWRARLLPASTLAPAFSALHYALDVFGWMDAAGQRLRGRRLARQPGLADRAG